MSAPEVVLASRSAGKLRELRPLFEAEGFAVRDLQELGVPEAVEEDAIEAHETFEANARAKARYFFARCGGRPVVADDSGLEVHALGGAPGVRSKRWSGRADLQGVALDEANNTLLLERLRGAADRGARYVCVVVYWDGAREVVARGEVSGRIAEQRASGPHGFGYDPYFVADELGRSFADVAREEKATVSHRGRAFAALLRELRSRR
ncbi:MAG TPA: non-canonical purine NTP pyrophosphatase [Gemmatimonadaceae bacterium]|nr:non-canonical purine NTP pyrophosphatase [Gemmatimonadaceae bacterium]